MSADVITGIIAAIVPLVGAITALIYAIRAKGTATVAQGVAVHALGTVNDHIVRIHDAFPIQPADPSEGIHAPND